MAHHNTVVWITPTTDIHGDVWVVSTDQKDLYRSNGVDRTSTNNGASQCGLTVNTSDYH
jgi:hypothetical protein